MATAYFRTITFYDVGVAGTTLAELTEMFLDFRREVLYCCVPEGR